MPSLRTKQELASLAQALAANNAFTEYKEHIYIPRDYETGVIGLTDNDRMVWHRMTPKEFRVFSNDIADILFATDAEFRSFLLMTKQFAARTPAFNSVLVPIKDKGVYMLNSQGEFVEAGDYFVPNALNITYDPDVDTTFIWETIVGWLNGEEQAHSLLHHLSLALQPWWTATKYILLIGEGSNGKSMLLRMLFEILGAHNVSNVKRQDMAAQRPTILNLNGAMANIVFDGPKEFVKDSSTEKTLTAGERLDIELKYENIASTVQTHALFIEGLNNEPKGSENTHAMHRRLVRFQFPNEYEEDLEFEDKVMHPDSLSALLKLILEHWVERGDKKKLAATKESKQLQLEQQWSTSPLMQYLEYLAATDQGALLQQTQKGALVDTLVTHFRNWLESNGYRSSEDAYLKKLVDELFITTRKTVRVSGKPSTRRVIVGKKQAAELLLGELVTDDVV